MSNLDSINNPFDIKVFFLSNVFTAENFHNHLSPEKIKEYEKDSPNNKARERPAIFKFVILQTLYIAKTIYGISDVKINEKYMQELNKVIIADFNDVFDEDEDENDLASINAKKEYDFILKHDNTSDEFLNDYITIHNELGYE